MASSVPDGIGAKLAAAFRSEADRRVRRLAETVLERAKADAPPSPPPDVDPDTAVSLRASGHVRRVREGVYEIVFDVPYAAKQHEAQGYRHPHGGGAKYLERNVQQAARDLEGTLALGVRAVTRRGDTGSVRVSTRRF